MEGLEEVVGAVDEKSVGLAVAKFGSTHFEGICWKELVVSYLKGVCLAVRLA